MTLVLAVVGKNTKNVVVSDRRDLNHTQLKKFIFKLCILPFADPGFSF